MAHTILLVDDEENILKALVRLLRKTEHETIAVTSAAMGLDILKDRKISLIISDQRMPGMTGTQFLNQAKTIQPEAIRIILTGYSDIKSAMEAINTGQVYRFLAKPWEDEVLLSTVREALNTLDIRREHAELQRVVFEQNETLKKLNSELEGKVAERTAQLYDSLNKLQLLNSALKEQNTAIIRGYADLIDLRYPPLGEHCRRVARMVKPMCEVLEMNDTAELKQILIAALLHDIGKVGLPDLTLTKDHGKLYGEEQTEMRKHTIIGQGQVQALSELSTAGLYIRYHHENYDGTGYPDGLAGEAIPLGARMIRVLDAYDHASARLVKSQPVLPSEVLESIYVERGKKYDYDVVRALIDITHASNERFERRGELKLPMEELTPGMTLSRDVRTKKGMLVLPSDEPLNEGHIARMMNYTKLYAIDKMVFVYRK